MMLALTSCSTRPSTTSIYKCTKLRISNTWTPTTRPTKRPSMPPHTPQAVAVTQAALTIIIDPDMLYQFTFRYISGHIKDGFLTQRTQNSDTEFTEEITEF
jgi:hypothetical protein